jgi:phage FluMu protein Com
MSLGTIVLLMAIAGIVAFVVLRGANKPQTPKPDPKPDVPANNPPVPLAPAVLDPTSSIAFIGDLVRIDMRHRHLGCDENGKSVLEVGSYDPEGDMVEYAVSAEGPSSDGASRVKYPIWNDYGKRIDRAGGVEWIKNGDESGFAVGPKGGYDESLEPVAACRFMIGWTKPETPYPFVAVKGCPPPMQNFICPECFKKITQASFQMPKCPNCSAVMVVVLPPSTEKLGEATFTYWVRDTKGLVASHTSAWQVYRKC